MTGNWLLATSPQINMNLCRLHIAYALKVFFSFLFFAWGLQNLLVYWSSCVMNYSMPNEMSYSLFVTSITHLYLKCYCRTYPRSDEHTVHTFSLNIHATSKRMYDGWGQCALMITESLELVRKGRTPVQETVVLFRSFVYFYLVAFLHS